MPIPTAILFVVASLAALLLGVGWWLDPDAPTLAQWFTAKVTDGGLWSGLFLFLIAAFVFTLRGDRKGKRPDGPP